jgi:hypothetical protein
MPHKMAAVITNAMEPQTLDHFRFAVEYGHIFVDISLSKYSYIQKAVK